MANSAKHV